jgi:AraC-like DNA-binding protein
MGALAQGFGAVAPTLFPVGMFAEPVDALAWLDAPPSLAVELEYLQAAALHTTPLLRDMRAQLRGRLRGAALATVAAALGLSARSLQRKLREHGTSFQRELNRLRVEEAQQLLVDSDATVTEIAMAVGSASVHHFGTLFRRFTGVTPTQWRAHQSVS